MKHTEFILSVLLLCFGIGAHAENIVTVSSTEGAPDAEVTVSVALQNSDVLSSLQVSIPLDESLTLVDNSALIGSRCLGHSLTVGVKDGVLNVFIYSLSMTAITGNSGEVCSFKLKLGSQPETINLTPSAIKMVNTGGSEVAGTSQGGSVTTRCPKAQYSTMEVDFGEVPIRSTYQRTVTVTNVGNEDLTITGLTFSDVNVFSSTTATSLPLNIPAGQSQVLNITYAPTERGSIARTLKVECNSSSKLNTIALKAQPFAVNELHIQPVTGISDQEVTISMTMNNMDDISGYQVDFTLPDQLEYVDGSFVLSNRKQDHQSVVSLNNGVLRIIVYSNSDKPLADNDGEIGSFRVKLVGRNSVTLKPSNTVLSATINHVVQNVTSAVYGGLITIQSPQIHTNSSLNFGAVAVTEPCEKTFTIQNYGSAPLTISRILFNNEHMSIKETLPLEVSANYSSKDITVVYDGIDQASFEGTMQIYSNDPDMRLREVSVTGSRFAPNYVTVNTPTVFAGKNVKIDISIDNYDPITGLQFDVEYPGQYFETFDDNISLSTRATGMTVTPKQIDDNTLRFFCYFLAEGNVAAGSGKALTIQLKPKVENIPEGSYNISLKNITLGTSEMNNKYAGPETLSSTFEITSVILGDANNDGKVSITDAVGIVNCILGNPSEVFNKNAADVNGDGKITITDAVGVVNIILNSSVTSSAR